MRRAQMEPGTAERCYYGEFIQRFAYRNSAKTTRRRVANSLRCFAQPTKRIGSCNASKQARREQHEAAREMGRYSGKAGPALFNRRTSSLQIFAAVIDRRYSKTMQSEQLAYAIVTPYSMRK